MRSFVASVIIHFLLASFQLTLGSRKSRDAGIFYYRVAAVFCPCFTIVKAVGNALVLKVISACMLTCRIVTGIDGYQWRFAIFTKP